MREEESILTNFADCHQELIDMEEE